ncbi:amidase [Paenibacillus sinopodophylli]|uniref:amidase n=1 Tax=Paenibacillus sinopodophylli TaxID=1837342 RepID=UPI00110CA5AC|nr:amidase [Paenibacillus sinopodophylli]
MMIKSYFRRSILTALVAVTVSTVSVSSHPVVAQEKFRFEEVTTDQLLEGYVQGSFTTEEVVQAYLDRINTYEASYNAFTFINSDALKEAKEVDRLRKSGVKLGPLAGIPVVIKESVDVAGYPSTFGWAKFSKEVGGLELMPREDALLVKRLKESGAIIIGKTNIPAFSGSGTNANTSWAGPTYNAIDRSIAPGGSSSGTATAVSANFAVLGIAEETSGSLQNPSAAQNIVGIKPTYGLIPSKGIEPVASSTLDTAGPHARTVKDVALLLDVIAGYSKDDPTTKLDQVKVTTSYASNLNQSTLIGKRFGLLGPSWRTNLSMSEETQSLYNRAIEELKKEGAEVVEDPFQGTGFSQMIANVPSSGIEPFFYDQQKYVQALHVEGENELTSKRLFEKVGAFPWATGGPLSMWIPRSFPDVNQALATAGVKPNLTVFNNQRNQFRDLIIQVMDKYQLDGFVYPQALTETPKLNSNEQIKATTVPEINISGLPIITVPAGYYEKGASFGLAFFGKAWSEKTLIEIAYAYEQATHYRKAPALVVDTDPIITIDENITFQGTGRNYPVKKVVLHNGKKESKEFEETTLRVKVDGQEVELEGYNMDNQHVFKLRDLATVLDGTDKQFEINWNPVERIIVLNRGISYTPLYEDESSNTKSFFQKALKVQTTFEVEGRGVGITGYRIGDYTYLKLEDLAPLLKFDLSGNEIKSELLITTK